MQKNLLRIYKKINFYVWPLGNDYVFLQSTDEFIARDSSHTTDGENTYTCPYNSVIHL